MAKWCVGASANQRSDGGHRRFILCEMMPYVDDVTAERVQRVVTGYGEGKKIVDSTGEGFSYYDLLGALSMRGRSTVVYANRRARGTGHALQAGAPLDRQDMIERQHHVIT